MKVALFSVVVLVATVFQVSARQWSEAELEALKALKFEDLPRELQIVIRKQKKSGGDSSNWCCINDQPMKSIQRTKVQVEFTKVQTKVKVGYTKCGFLSTMMCSTYDVRYTNKPTYFVAYYEVPDPSACSEADIKCCSGYLLVAGNCLTMENAAAYQENLLKLFQGGLLGPGK